MATSSKAYQKALTADLGALDRYIVTDFSEFQFLQEESDSSFTGRELEVILECARTGDFSEFYRLSPKYIELPSGAGFVWDN